MMRIWRFMAALLMLALLASTLVPKYLEGLPRPDFFALMLLYAAARAESEDLLPLCWGVGLFKDILSAGPLGLYALVYLGAGFLIARTRATLDMKVALTQTGMAFALAWTTEFICAWALAGTLIPPWYLVEPLFFNAILTAALAPLLFALLDRRLIRRRTIVRVS